MRDKGEIVNKARLEWIDTNFNLKQNKSDDWPLKDQL